MGQQGPPAGQMPPREEPPRLLREFFIPTEYDRGARGMRPHIGAAHYEIKASSINMIPSFYGLASDDPYCHLDEFLDVCATVRISHIEDDASRLHLFPFSLKEKANDWLKSLPLSVWIATWEDLRREFLKKYFPIGKTIDYRRAITTFSALEGESFHQAWERMKELLRRYLHHQIPRWQVLQGFYDGLIEAHRQNIDSSCGGSLMLKSEEEAWVLFDTLLENSLHNTGPSVLRHQLGKRGVLELGSSPQVQSQLDSLSRKMDQLLTRGTGLTRPVCGLYDCIGHVTDDCPISVGIDAPAGQVNAAQGFSRPAYDPYSCTYNPEWRNYPNFGWRNSGYQSQTQSVVSPQRQIAYSQPSGFQASSSYSTLEDRLLKKLKQQMGQLAKAMRHRRIEGSLPSQPLGNPKGKGPVFVVEGADCLDTYNVAALRSG
ncbi:unnamed protein product [Victoria cruziana]